MIFTKFLLVSSLMVGYNYKFSEHIQTLKNCINDAKGYSSYFKNGDVITDDTFTTTFFKHRLGKKYFEMKFKQLLEKDINEVKILTFSGHGYRDVSNNYESIIFPTNEEMTDHEFEDLIKSCGKEFKLVCIFDSCFSGSILNLPYVYEVKMNHFVVKYRKNYSEFKNGFIIQISSCQDIKTSYELPKVHSHGLFTEHLLHYLNQHNGKVTYRQVIKYLHSRMLFFRQFPVIASSRPIDLDTQVFTFEQH